MVFGVVFDEIVLLMVGFRTGTGEYLETALPALCRAAAQLPVSAQAELARRWAKDGRPVLKTLLESLQQLITLRVIVTHFNPDFFVQDENVITSATKLMKVSKT